MAPFEIIVVNEVEVICDGGSELLGHPRVYLHIDTVTREIECPYCSCLFVFADTVPTITRREPALYQEIL